MKILFVSQFYFPERISSSQIAESFKRQGHEVSVITDKPNYGFGKILPEYKHVDDEVINGVSVHRINVFPRKKGHLSVILNYLSFHNKAKRYARRIKDKYDVVFSMSLSPVISIAPAITYATKHKVPHVLFCLDLWPESTVVTGAVKYNSLFYKILYKWSVSLYKKCDKIIVSSPSFVDYFKNVLHIDNKEFIHINQPVLFDSSFNEPIVYSNKHNVIYAGNIGKLQLVTLLVEAMQNTNDVVLHLMGMGSEVDTINKMITDYNLSNKVIYHGIMKASEVEKYFWNADALIVSLSNKGTVGKTIPNKAIQYLQYSRPIIGVIDGDGKDLLSKAGGTIFAKEDAKDIANIINSVCKIPLNKKSELGKLNRDYFDKYLTTSQLTQEISDVLADSINNVMFLD